MTNREKIEELESLIRVLTATCASKKRLDVLYSELEELRKNEDT